MFVVSGIALLQVSLAVLSYGRPTFSGIILTNSNTVTEHFHSFIFCAFIIIIMIMTNFQLRIRQVITHPTTTTPALFFFIFYSLVTKWISQFHWQSNN